MSGDWYFEMQVYRRKYNRLVRKHNRLIKRVGGSGDVNYTKWRRSFMWSAAWKASAKKWRKHSIAVDDYCDAQVAYQHSLEYSQHTSWKRAEAAEQRVAELEVALEAIRDLARTGLAPDILHYKVNRVAGIANAALNKDREV